MELVSLGIRGSRTTKKTDPDGAVTCSVDLRTESSEKEILA
jgi:hypothetical protein